MHVIKFWLFLINLSRVSWAVGLGVTVPLITARLLTVTSKDRIYNICSFLFFFIKKNKNEHILYIRSLLVTVNNLAVIKGTVTPNPTAQLTLLKLIKNNQNLITCII